MNGIEPVAFEETYDGALNFFNRSCCCEVGVSSGA
jgi:hypothetical protein